MVRTEARRFSVAEVAGAFANHEQDYGISPQENPRGG